jgi:hypothetical protein
VVDVVEQAFERRGLLVDKEWDVTQADDAVILRLGLQLVVGQIAGMVAQCLMLPWEKITGLAVTSSVEEAGGADVPGLPTSPSGSSPTRSLPEVSEADASCRLRHPSAAQLLALCVNRSTAPQLVEHPE